MKKVKKNTLWLSQEEEDCQEYEVTYVKFFEIFINVSIFIAIDKRVFKNRPEINKPFLN